MRVLALVCVLGFALGVRAGEVTEPPAKLRLDPFYKKYISAGGYPIVASGRVSDFALKEAAYLVGWMLAGRDDLLKVMASSESRLVIMGSNEFVSDIPEYDRFEPKDYWDVRSRGFGGSEEDPICSVGEENLLGYRGDPYSTESIFVHEFAHHIHLRGLVRVDPSFDKRLRRAYKSAMEKGLWKGKYAAVNSREYWAEGVQSWFGTNRKPDHDHNHVDTRKELVEYDPGLAKLCEEVFGKREATYTKPTTRLVGHLKGFDPKKAPQFRWPERLRSVRLDRRLDWKMADGAIPQSVVGGKPTWVMFTNKRASAVKVYWISYEGERRLYKKLRPRGRLSQRTFAGSTWLVTDDSGKTLGFFVADEHIAQAEIPR